MCRLHVLDYYGLTIFDFRRRVYVKLFKLSARSPDDDRQVLSPLHFLLKEQSLVQD
jgi:hypothetical protein